MNPTFEHIILKTELSQSEAFGSLYKELFETRESPAFNNPLVEDLTELLNGILLKHDTLTDFQKGILDQIFNEFNNIRLSIDPKRLKSFEHYFNVDNELLLYRETEKGLINIIINPEDCIAFSYIPNNDEQRQLYFVHQDGDFEKLTYDFFSH